MVGISPGALPKEGEDPSSRKNVKMGDFVFGTVVLVVYMLGLFVWVGIFLNNMDFDDRYRKLSPFMDSSFRTSARGGWEWGFIYTMFLVNVLMGYLLAAAICNNSHPRWSRIHLWFTGLALFANVIFFVALSVMWLFVCNTSFSAGSPCNDPRWCCNYYADNPKWCPNTIGCPTNPPGGSISLQRSEEFLVTWIYSILFIVIAWIHRGVNKELQRAGMFKAE